MIKRPFFGWTKPDLKYSVIEDHEQRTVTEIPIPERVTLLLRDAAIKMADLAIKVGDKVRSGQKLKAIEECSCYLVSTVTGTVSGISEYPGSLGNVYPAISIETAGEDDWDDEFKKLEKTPTPDMALDLLRFLPENPDFGPFMRARPSLDTIVINGMDTDLLITNNQLTIKTEMKDLIAGISLLKKMTQARRAVIVVPTNLSQEAEKTGAEVKVVKPVYPNGLPNIIMKKVLGRVVPAGKSCEDLGVGFVNAETVVSLSKSITEGEASVNKILTVVGKDSTQLSVRARIGTHVKDILNALHIEANPGDRIILGGPMFGYTIYSEETPISPNTQAIMVQDKNQIQENMDNHCVNCGECVRACPADIPVNMLVRLLENSLFEEAVTEYDLLSCIGCGLCTYVCPARIQIFHHIALGKYEFERIIQAEESHE